MTTGNFRFYIKLRITLNIPARVIHDELNSVYGDEASDLSTVERWSKLFREGREEIEDKARPGRPVTETTPENIVQIRLLIDDGLYITIKSNQERTNLSYGTVQRTIRDYLKIRKITARYMPKDLTDLQRAERVRICKQNLEKFHQGTWRLCDIITGDETRGIKIHHDNGRPHVHKDVSDYLESEGLAKIPYPPNSPDLSPCDFWLFDLIKNNLTDQDDSESLHDAVTDFMHSLNRDNYKKTFVKWIERMRLC
ncbi:unnamed protein product, partial [Rotaria sp. Silwood2]